MNKTLFIVMFFGLLSCQEKNDFVLQEFKSQIQKKGFRIDSVDSEGLIHIKIDQTNLKISLENLRRDYERDRDPEIISDFVNTILNSANVVFGNWRDSQRQIYISFFSNDYDFRNVIHEKVTEEFSKVYVLSNEEKLSWITPNDLKRWNISQNELEHASKQNLDILLSKTPIKFELIDNRKLGMIEAENTALKSSLLFAPNFRTKVEKEIGFPFYAVIPVRDFCYIFSEKDFDFFSKRIGDVVVQEYKQSGYPITTEILKFTENGIVTVGKYPAN